MIRALEELKKDRSFMVFVDPQVGQSNGYLRSLPLIAPLLGNDIKKVVIWEPGRNCNKPLNVTDFEFQFIHPQDVTFSDQIHVAFTNREKEQQYQHIEKIVEMRVPSVVVVDKANLIPAGWKSVKKTLESKSPFPPLLFTPELVKYLSKSSLDKFQMYQTKNAVFVAINYFHSRILQKKAENLSALIDFENDKLSVSPIWDWALKLLSLREENSVRNFLFFAFNAFRPWLERNKDVRTVADKFTIFLKKLGYNRNRVLKLRKSNFERSSDFYSSLIDEHGKTFLGGGLIKQMERLGCLQIS